MHFSQNDVIEGKEVAFAMFERMSALHEGYISQIRELNMKIDGFLQDKQRLIDQMSDASSSKDKLVKSL